MNAKILALTLATALSGSAFATPPDSVAVIVNCQNADWPTPREIARYVNASSFDEVDAARRQMLRDGRRACRRGASQVQLIFLANQPDARQVAAQGDAQP